MLQDTFRLFFNLVYWKTESKCPDFTTLTDLRMLRVVQTHKSSNPMDPQMYFLQTSWESVWLQTSPDTTMVCNILVHKYRVWTFEFRQRLTGQCNPSSSPYWQLRHQHSLYSAINTLQVSQIKGDQPELWSFDCKFPSLFFSWAVENMSWLLHVGALNKSLSINIHATIRTTIPAWFW